MNNSDFSDICFIVEGQKIQAHKVILAARSPHFRKMFELNRAAKEQTIKQVTRKAFMGLLEYLYTGSVHGLNKEWAAELMELALEHELIELQKYVERFIDSGSRSNSIDYRSGSIGSIGSRSDSMDMIETVKMQETRSKVAREIFETEKTYYNSLKMIYTVNIHCCIIS